jgi:hypothetical protein
VNRTVGVQTFCELENKCQNCEIKSLVNRTVCVHTSKITFKCTIGLYGIFLIIFINENMYYVIFLWMCSFMCFSAISVRSMEFIATFNNISVISLRSVLLVKEPGKTTDLSQVTDKLRIYI